MITLANIRKAIYCLNKRIDLLEQNGISGGSSGEGASSSEVAEIRGKVEALESIISEGDNPTAAIDKFNEIVAFLESIQNTDTLSGLLADIATLIPTNVSELLNDAGYLTQHLDISGKSDKLSMNGENAAVEDNIMSISSNGNPKDSGISANDIVLKTGYYKNLHAGLADNLFDETQTNDVFTFRPTAGIQDVASGDAPVGGGTIKKVEGNAVAWNQLIGTVNSYLSHIDYSTYRFPFDIDNTNGTTKLYGFIQYGEYFLGLPATIINHRYYTRNTVEFTSNDTFNAFYATSQQASGLSENVGASVSLCTVSCPNDRLRIRGLEPGKHVTGYITIIRIDLTLLGIDNLTTVAEVEQWLANNVGLKDYYPYNEGELIPVKDFKVKSVGFNLWDEQWEVGSIDSDTGENYSENNSIRSKNFIPVFPNTQYYIYCTRNLTNWTRQRFYDKDKKYIGYQGQVGGNGIFTTPDNCYYVRFHTYQGAYGSTYNHDICINLSYDGGRDGEYEEHWERDTQFDITTLTGKLNGEGNSVVVFPDGMKSAGIVKDEIVRSGDVVKAIKKVGVVDLGTLEWSLLYNTNTNGFQCWGIYPADYTSYCLICAKYKTIYVHPTNWDDAAADKLLYNRGNGSIIVNDSAYTDAATFKAAMSGVMTYYELATPQEYILDEDILPVQYRVDNYGTEEVLLDNDEGLVSSSPKMTISYGINAADTIADLSYNFVSTTRELDFTEAQKNRIALNIGTQRITLADKNNWNNKPNLWRGTLVLYDALVANNQIDNNTIYVIIESLS